MAKARITFTIVKVYEINPEYYPDCDTPEQMLAIDLAGAQDDPFSSIGDDAEFDIKAELV